MKTIRKIKVLLEIDGELKDNGKDMVVSFPYDLTDYNWIYEDIEISLKKDNSFNKHLKKKI